MQQAQNTCSRVTSRQTLPDRNGTTCLMLPEQYLAEPWWRVDSWPTIPYYLLALLSSCRSQATLRLCQGLKQTLPGACKANFYCTRHILIHCSKPTVEHLQTSASRVTSPASPTATDHNLLAQSPVNCPTPCLAYCQIQHVSPKAPSQQRPSSVAAVNPHRRGMVQEFRS